MSPSSKNHLDALLIAAAVAITSYAANVLGGFMLGHGEGAAVTRLELREELAPLRLDVAAIKTDVADLKTDKAIRDDRDKRGLASAGLLK